jgi:hypothetical protein
MNTKTLDLNLGRIRVLQDNTISPVYLEGWYIDPLTNQRVYYKAETETFYTMAGGVYIPLGYMTPAPKQVALGPGEKLKITISYKYSGPAVSGAIERFCIGVYGTFGFNETLVGENTRSLPASTTPLQYTGSYTFTIPTSVGSDWDDIYCKVYGGSPGVPQTLFGYEQALLIVGKDPTISEFTIADFAKV